LTIKLWRLISSKKDRSLRIFDLRTDRAISPRTNKEHDFYVLESSDWVNVIPLTRQNEVVLIRQYRHGIRRVTLEIPGGIVEQGDSPEETARRELFEETGYSSSDMILVGSVHANPAFLNNFCYSYLARDVSSSGGQEQDEKEDIEIVIKPLEEIPRLIREGEITHSLVLAAFYRFYMEYKPSQS
jgi:8-oxo-dGTP pyrophosphatase MutT (NUDIX family)